MKVYLIGHKNRIDKIKEVIISNYQNIEIEILEYSLLEETEKVCNIVKERQHEFDAILFTGSIPFYLVNNHLILTIPCDYIHRDNSSILKVLIKIIINKEKSIKKISYDTYDKSIIYKIYSDIGLNKNELFIKTPEISVLDEDYINKIYDFHKKQYEFGKVSCCITALNNVYEKLIETKIPAFILDPSTEVVKDSIIRIQLKHSLQTKEKTKIIVINIQIDFLKENKLASENEYHVFLKRMKITEEIYLFAQRIQAAIVEESAENFILFCTKSALEIETNNYQSIDILQNINKKFESNIYIGIGHGITAREAKFNAKLGLSKAKSHGENTAYIIYEEEKIIGPIKNISKLNQIKEERIIDKKFYIVSQKSGISINKIFLLFGMIEQYKKDVFTSHEISEKLKLSLRTTNKIIKKLEEKDFVEIIGKKSKGSSGRPSRLIKILF